MSTSNKLIQFFDDENISPLPSPPQTSSTTVLDDESDVDDVSLTEAPYNVNLNSPILKLKMKMIAANAKKAREIYNENAAIAFAKKKKDAEELEQILADKEYERQEKLIKFHHVNGTLNPTELDNLYAEQVYRMKYYYLMSNDPYYAEKLKEWYQKFRGFCKEWHHVGNFDPIVNYWLQDRDRHDKSYHNNTPSTAIMFKQNIDNIYEYIPNRYAMMFFDDFNFEARYP